MLYQGGYMKPRPLSMLCLLPALLLLMAGAALAQSVLAPPITPQSEANTEVPAAKEPPPAAVSPLPAGIDKAFEKALDKKLAPIMRTLAEMQEQKIRLTDVLGGLGYIFGLMGVAVYFKRKA
jgi:nickel transport protein